MGRFVNGDVFPATGQGILGNNMFAYCGNNPVSRIDSSGQFFFTVLGAVVGAAFGALDAAIQKKSPEEFKAAIVSGAISGAVSGAAADVLSFTGATVGAAICVMAIASGSGSAIGSIYEYSTTGDRKIDSQERAEMAKGILFDAAVGGLFAYMGGPVASQLDKIAKKGFAAVAKTFYTQEAKNTIGNLAEEALTTVTAGMIEFTGMVFKRMWNQSVEMWFD